MLCPECNFQISNPQAKFCPSCGAEVNQLPNTSSMANPEVSSTTQISFPSFPKKPLIIVGAILVLVILSVLGLSFVKNSLTGKTNSLLNTQKTNLPSKTSVTGASVNSQATPRASAQLSKYDVDTDGDSIPDFVEAATGYNPNQDECLLAACEGYDANAQPKTKTNVMFILDSSGSMAGVSGANRKIDAAQNALKRYIVQAKADTSAGLVVYGHKGSNSEKDKALSCQGIEVLYPQCKYFLCLTRIRLLRLNI
ncbi:hypothetical protein L6255_03065 [Candidatus Parcubacteria bacterium]|nr:hypothetical protein [Patescibacteria group bacterium]MCG2689394.1 hypothetical protein [Candidatus Parcubacteria bacterium]